jgi:proteasome lid subunit RPN8/RPN11
MTAVATDSLPEGQREAIEALCSLARASDGALTVDLDYEQIGRELDVRVYLSTASLQLDERDSGLKDWEPIDIAIPDDFPYTSPIASTGRDDFPELPHQARGSKFCVRVEKNDWDPAMGMPGFMRAVIDAYQHIALGTLQGRLQSWRPVVRYPGEGWAVIRADLAAAEGAGPGTSFRWAVGIPVGESRIDIIEWLSVDAGRADASGAAPELAGTLAAELARINAETPDAFLVPAVTVAKPVALEYCRTWEGLLYRLKEQGVDRARTLGHLARVTMGQPPSNGAPVAALFRVAADTGSTTAGQDGRFAVARLTQRDVELIAGLHAPGGDQAARLQARDELFDAPVPWVRVYDGRPEAIGSRAAGRPTAKLAGAKILLLGCGGLGAPIAEHCARSGAARVHIVDSGTVNPGILSRQPYEDADIGKPKAEVLAARLKRIYPGNEFLGLVGEIAGSGIFSMSFLNRYDLIIDATASRSVAAQIERSWRDEHGPWPALITVAINQQATHGVAAMTPHSAVGAGVDLLRRMGLITCMSTAFGDVYAAFFPPQTGRLNFRPDTSCSDTTFIGSTTDMGALAAQLLDSALARLATPLDAVGTEPPHRSLSVVRLGRDDPLRAARAVFDLPPDCVVMDHRQVYEVRIAEAAMETMREYTRASVNGRIAGAGHTGGLLLGQFDSACRIAWVSQATGLPPGSSASSLRIELGVDEVQDLLDDRGRRSGGMLALVGFWHTHPGSAAAPSDEDRATMRELVASSDWPSGPALLVVLGIPGDGAVGEPWAPEIHAETFVK